MTPRLLITGWTGFLGRPCFHYARVAGIEVHAVARECHSLASTTAFTHSLDLFDTERVRLKLAEIRPTHLLHLAWIATPGVYWTSPENERWRIASRELLNTFAEVGGQRVAIAGTCAEYDRTGNGVCHEFDTPTQPSTPYGVAKNSLRLWAEAFGHSARIGIAWPRLFFLYGPREHPARLVPSVTNALLAGEPAECTAGTQERDFLHVDDAAAALVQLVLSDVTGPVNIGSGEAVSVRTVVETIADIVGQPDLLRLGAKPMPPNDPPLLVADVGRLRNEVKWAPRIGLRRGLEDTVAWWRGRNAG